MARLAVIVLLGAACSRPPPPAVRDPSTADLSLQGVTLRSFSGGTLKVVTTAETLEAWREVGTRGELLARDAGVWLVHDDLRIAVPVVRGNFLTGQLEGEGGVTLRGREGRFGFTPRVSFDRTQGGAGVVSSDAGVQWSQPGVSMRAAGFTVDLAEEHLHFDAPRTTLSR